MTVISRNSLIAVLSGFAVLAGTAKAFSGCSNYVDGSTDTKPPRAEICFKGKCEITVLTVECGNKDGGFNEYANGWTVSYDYVRSRTVVKKKNAIISKRDWKLLTCREIDEGGCFGDLKQ